MSTHNIPFLNIKKKITLNYQNSAAIRFFQGNKERVRNIRGKRAISVRAIEVLLYNTAVPTITRLRETFTVLFFFFSGKCNVVQRSLSVR